MPVALLGQQNANVGNENSQTLNESYKTLYEKAETYNDYKVFKSTGINTLWKQVLDSLSWYQAKISTRDKKIEELNLKIEELGGQIRELDQSLQRSRKEAGSVTVLGMLIPEGVYNIIVWGIVLTLAVIIFFGYGRYQRSIHRHNTINKEHLKMTEEFENFKKRSLEKKVRLARELQTERNRVEELEGRLGSKQEKYLKN